MSLNELDESSFEISIKLWCSNTVFFIDKFSQTHTSLMKLELYNYNGGSISLKSNDESLNFEYLYQLCDHAYTSARKSISLQRYKGLGKMIHHSLLKLLNPETRSLLQVSQIDDEDYIIFDTLMGDDVEKRRDFIVSSAILSIP